MKADKKKTTLRKAPARRTPSEQKRSAAKKAPTKKAAAKATTARKMPTAKKSTKRISVAKKAPAKKATAKKAPARTTPIRRVIPREPTLDRGGPVQVVNLVHNNGFTKPIRSDEELDAALAEIAKLWGAAPGSREADRLDLLTILIQAYEDKYHPIGLPDPIDAIKERMSVLDWKQQDLADALDVGKGRASEILNRKRKLTLPMVRVLSAKLGLSIECLANEYALAS